MICEACHGEGIMWADSIPAFGVMPGDPDRPDKARPLQWPCEACGGTGFAHCCEGERPDCAPDTNQGQNDG